MPTNKAIRQANRVARAVASRTPHQPRCAMWPGNRSYAFCPGARSMARSKSCSSMGCGTEATTRARVARRHIWPSSRNHRIFYGEEGPLENALDSIFCLYQRKQVVVRYLPPTCLAAQQCIASMHQT